MSFCKIPILNQHSNPVTSFGKEALSKDETKELIKNGNFSLLANPKKGKGFLEETVFSVQNTYTKISRRDLPSNFVRVEQISLPAGEKSRNLYHLWLNQCGETSCDLEKGLSESASNQLKNWEVLPRGVEIDKIYSGDADGDSLGDVLLVLSNGAGLLFTHKSSFIFELKWPEFPKDEAPPIIFPERNNFPPEPPPTIYPEYYSPPIFYTEKPWPPRGENGQVHYPGAQENVNLPVDFHSKVLFSLQFSIMAYLR